MIFLALIVGIGYLYRQLNIFKDKYSQNKKVLDTVRLFIASDQDTFCTHCFQNYNLLKNNYQKI